MPGMMDTVLNLGLNDEIAESFAEKIGNKRFVYDSYRRFIQMFADVVKGYAKSKFETIIDEIKVKKATYVINNDSTLLKLEEDFNRLFPEFLNIYSQKNKTILKKNF